MTIPVTARVADVQLQITTNTGAPAGQVAEFQVIGDPGAEPGPDRHRRVVDAGRPGRDRRVTLSATVRNAGTRGLAPRPTSTSTSAPPRSARPSVGGLAAGASTTVTANIGTRDAGTLPAERQGRRGQHGHRAERRQQHLHQPDRARGRAGRQLRPGRLAGRAGRRATRPAGNTVTFSVADQEPGHRRLGAAARHGITLTVLNDAGRRRQDADRLVSAARIAAGATSAPVNLGTWTAANGKYTVKVVLADDANELPVKQANNTSDQPFFVGRGANMPYDMYEAEDGVDRRRRARSSARTGPSATSPARRPAAGPSR